MTIVFSTISSTSDLITMTVDSAVTRNFSMTGQNEYKKGQKIYCYEGVGCVATWGSRDHNQIGRFLSDKSVSPKNHTIYDLANLVHTFLTQVYRPHDLNVGDVGYHVAGFDQDGRPRVFHIFWGTNRPPIPEEIPNYHFQKDLPQSHLLLYNGRNDLAWTVINSLLKEYYEGRDTNYDLTQPISLVEFGDFVARFSAELTPEVGPPFITTLISPKNSIAQVRNNFFEPINVNLIVRELVKLGYSVTGDIFTPHENVVRALPNILRQLLENSSQYKLSTSHLAIATSSVIERFPKLYLNNETVVYPDLLLSLSGECYFDLDDCWHGPPDLVIEVFSPETERDDRGIKFESYRDNGVREYWMINPIGKFIEVWCFEIDTQPERVGIFGVGDESFNSCALSCMVDQESIEKVLGIMR